MSGFDPAWLALREPYDHAARCIGLTEAFVEALGPSPELIDLGCGSGSNLRYLSRRLPDGQHWLCVDHDEALLDLVERGAGERFLVRTLRCDLAADLETLPLDPGAAVTAAALLDLTSAAWLDRLAARCRGLPLLMTLSFDGRLAWGPEDPEDEVIRAAFLAHQRRDKGFGPAQGAEAAAYLAERLKAVGHGVELAQSDWRFSAGPDRPILEAMLHGLAGAAREIDDRLPSAAWLARRRSDLEAGSLSLLVGHVDLLALPA